MNANSAPTSTYELAATLVQIAQTKEINIEQFRAEQVLAQCRRAWPGEIESMWPKWLAESAKSLGMHARIAELSLQQALDLEDDGAILVGGLGSTGEPTAILDYDGRCVKVMTSVAEGPQKILSSELEELVASSASDGTVLADTIRWVIVDDLELSHEQGHIFHDRPIHRLFALLRPERSDIWVVAVFAFFAGVLSLATPIAVESLVNTVAFGRLLQPLIILSLMLFGFLVFASLMRALQAFVVEIIQRRLFARVAADLAYRFSHVQQDELRGNYGPELANRFFEIVTLQKVVAHLLLDGIAILLATAVGMAVLAFYHPWLLGFDVLLLVLVIGGLFALGRGAITSGIDESKQKYRLAAWLEDVIRCPISFKSAGAAEFAVDRANQVTAAYLISRRKHFRILFRQLLFILVLQAVAGTILLGFGGWLVIRGQLTLGQLVAAELIVATILGSLAKLGKHIEGLYDVVASVDKLGHLFDLTMEPQDGLLAFRPDGGARIRVTDVRHRMGGVGLSNGFSLSAEAGERIALFKNGDAGSAVLLDMLYGLRDPESGHIEIEHADPRDLRPDVLRKAVALVRDIEVFEGTIAENVHLARQNVSMTEVRTALFDVGLLDAVLRLPDGLDTKLHAGGELLQPTQLALLMLARTIAAQPQLLLVDELLDSLGDLQLQRVCETLCDRSRQWTLVVATGRHDVAHHFERIVELPSGDGSRPALLLDYSSPPIIATEFGICIMNGQLIRTSQHGTLIDAAYHEADFPSLQLARSSRLARRIAKWLMFALILSLLAMIFVPWQQSIRGDGAVVAFDPVNRTQGVQAPVKGVIAEIGKGIYENARVEKGQLVYRIADQDPQYLQRLRQQVDNTRDQLQAARQRFERSEDQLSANKRVVKAKTEEVASTRAAQTEAIAAANAYVQMAKNKLAAERAGLTAAADAVWQAELDFQRKKDLHAKGLETGLKFQEADLKLRQAKAKKAMADEYVSAAEAEVEAKKKERDSKQQEWQGKVNKVESELEKANSEVSKAEIEVAKTREEISKIKNEVTKLETQLARQETQDVVAPRDGNIMRLVAYDKSAIVKQGDTLFTIVPETDKPAVQIWVNGNDAPLIAPGRHVRLQFEGWPAAQFSGWPSVAVGTFGGKVALVDPTDDGAGKFRVVLVPDENDAPWPDYPYLRQGVRVHGWVLLDQVTLGYEIWRRMNGFPPSLKSKEESSKAKPPKVKI